MEFTIYIDVFFVVNFIIDCLLLIVTSVCSRRFYKTYRLILASSLGSLICVFTYLIDINILSLLIAIPTALLMIFVAFDFINLHKFIKTVIYFFAFSFALFAITYILFIATSLSYIIIYSGTMLYLNVNFGVLIIIMILLIVLAKIITLFYKIDMNASIYKVKVIYNGFTAEFCAFLDTGNLLCDVVNGLPVMIVEQSTIAFVLGLNDDEIKAVLCCSFSDALSQKFRYISYKGVWDENNLMPVFMPTQVLILIGNDFVEVETEIGITSTKLAQNGEYVALLSPLNLK